MARRRLIGALLHAVAFIGGPGISRPLDGASTQAVGSALTEGAAPFTRCTVQPQVDG